MNPDTVAVKGYVRTAPDGDVTNNLSYHGPDAKTVNVEAQGNDHVKTSLMEIPLHLKVLHSGMT